MSDENEYFLLVCDRAKARLVEEIVLGSDAAAAEEIFTQVALANAGDPSMEAVLIGSDSLDTIRVTHANYYPPSPEETRWFAGL